MEGITGWTSSKSRPLSTLSRPSILTNRENLWVGQAWRPPCRPPRHSPPHNPWSPAIFWSLLFSTTRRTRPWSFVRGTGWGMQRGRPGESHPTIWEDVLGETRRPKRCTSNESGGWSSLWGYSGGRLIAPRRGRAGNHLGAGNRPWHLLELAENWLAVSLEL